MADVPPSTFIPHDTAVMPDSRRRRGGGLNDLLLLCGIVLFVASVALAVAVFLYAQFLQTESASKQSQLQRAKDAFQPALIQQFTRLDDRMHFAEQIIGAHLAPSAFFDALEAATLQTVSFQSLSVDASDAQHISIKMAGVAQSVNSIALQADLFSKNGVITSPIFSNIARQNDGVHFDLAALVNPTAINYSGIIRASAQTAAAAAPSEQTSSSNSLFGGSGTSPSAQQNLAQ